MPLVFQEAERYTPRLTAVLPGAAGNQWALFVTDGALTCEGYDDGTFVDGATRATLGYSGGLEVDRPVRLIEVDSEALVGPGSFVFAAGDAPGVPLKIFVWDVVGEVVHEYEIPAGTRATVPVYVGGWLYWFEWPSDFVDPTPVSIMRGRADLSSISELEEFDVESQNGNTGGARVLLFIPRNLEVLFSWHIGNEDGHEQLTIFSKTLEEEGNLVDRTEDWSSALGIRHRADGATETLDGSVFGGAVDLGAEEDLSLFYLGASTSHDDGFDGGTRGLLNTLGNPSATTPATLWQDVGGAWSYPSPACLSIGDTVAQVYGEGHLTRHDRSTPIGPGDPAVSVEVDFHPELDAQPVAMFYRGA